MAKKPVMLVGDSLEGKPLFYGGNTAKVPSTSANSDVATSEDLDRISRTIYRS